MRQLNPIILMLWVFAALIGWHGVLYAHLPDLGSEYRETLSVADEKLVGDTWMRQIRGAGMVYYDPLVNEYIQYIGNKLTPYVAMPYSDIKIMFFAINDKSINAFAFFGGHVAVHSGLILTTESESELAGVMAHELAHISQQHILRQITDSKRMMPLTIAGSLAAILLGMPEMIIPVLASHGQQMLNFSRQHEQEADRIGMQILAQAKFDPQGMPNIFERMSLSSRYENKPPEYLLTHPLYESRISDTRHRATTFSYRNRENSNMFYLIRARIEIQSANNIQQLISDYEHKLNSQRHINQLGTQYGYAFALQEAGKPEQALQQLQPLLATYPDELILQLTAASVECDLQRFAAAQKRLERLLTMYSDSPSLQLQYTDLLLQTQQPKKAKKVLNQYKYRHALEPYYYELVRHAEGMLGNNTAVLEANAEWYLLNGAYDAAVEQLKIALDAKDNNSVTKQRISSRLKSMQDLIKKEKNI